MYYQKLTKKEKEDRLIRIMRKKNDIEHDYANIHPDSKKEMTAWRKYMDMPYEVKARIKRQWDNYYLEVHKSPICALFQEQRRALTARNFARAKDLADQARQMRENGDVVTVLKPTSIDPWEFNWGWVKDYLDCEKRIKELQDDLNAPEAQEQQEVWA